MKLFTPNTYNEGIRRIPVSYLIVFLKDVLNDLYHTYNISKNFTNSICWTNSDIVTTHGRRKPSHIVR